MTTGRFWGQLGRLAVPPPRQKVGFAPAAPGARQAARYTRRRLFGVCDGGNQCLAVRLRRQKVGLVTVGTQSRRPTAGLEARPPLSTMKYL